MIKSTIKILIKILIISIITYLFISGVYILFHIEFGEQPRISGPGFSESNNALRLFMGLPETHSTYELVSPIFLVEVIIKLVIAIILIIYLIKKK